MKTIDLASDSMHDYFSRIIPRLSGETGAAKRILQLQGVVTSAERHFGRLALAERRYRRALDLREKVASAYEHQVLLALMYEIMDTNFFVAVLLEPDELDLSSSADGKGLAGDSALDVVRLLSKSEQQCARLLEIERRLDVQLDFSIAVDEMEGITFENSPHWQDFVKGSVEASFFQYFARTQSLVEARLNQRPKFWPHQTVRQYLVNKGYLSIVTVCKRLELAHFPTERLERKDVPASNLHIWQFSKGAANPINRIFGRR